jgi:hypothetical protein
MKEVLARNFFKALVFFSLFFYTAFLLCTSASRAQSEPEAPTAKHVAPFTPPVFFYSSVFDNYHGYQDQEVASWLEANETVGRIGGWRYYLEEAVQPHQHPITRPEDSHDHSSHGDKP